MFQVLFLAIFVGATLIANVEWQKQLREKGNPMEYLKKSKLDFFVDKWYGVALFALAEAIILGLIAYFILWLIICCLLHVPNDIIVWIILFVLEIIYVIYEIVRTFNGKKYEKAVKDQETNKKRLQEIEEKKAAEAAEATKPEEKVEYEIDPSTMDEEQLGQAWEKELISDEDYLKYMSNLNNPENNS